MIKLENIQKVFRTEEVETVALGGVSLEVKKGEFVAIMGPSGCGKSTLLNILGLLDNPTSGQYLLDHPETSVICSGGQGSDEPYSEAEAFARAIERKGVSEERILKDGKINGELYRSPDLDENALIASMV